MSNYVSVTNLYEELEEPATGHPNRTVQNDESAKIILFRFAAGDGLAQHWAPMPALIQILCGDAILTIGMDTMEATAGFWVSMPPDLVHSIKATTPATMLLTLLKLPNSTARNG